MRTIANWEDVPLFDSEAAEADFWAENRPDLRLMEAAVAGGAEVSESVTITLRMDPRMLARIKRLARSRFLNYQSMIKQWMSERMEQELRERAGQFGFADAGWAEEDERADRPLRVFQTRAGTDHRFGHRRHRLILPDDLFV